MMMPIRSYEEATTAYSLIRMCEKDGVCKNHVIDLKRAVRVFMNKEKSKDRTIVRDMEDYVIVKILFPDYLETYEEAEKYFMEHEFMREPCSPYDCTGKWFTRSYDLFFVNGRWICYHGIACDC